MRLDAALEFHVTWYDKLFTEYESMEILRGFNQSLRRLTLYGGTNAEAIPGKVQRKARKNVRNNKNKK